MKKGTIILCIFVLVKMVLQYVIVNTAYELQRDEFLHLDQAKHLAWGYHSLPPLTSWLSVIIKELGNSIFWIRFFPALFGAITIVLVWKTVVHLKGSLYACVLSVTALLFSSLLRLNILYQPNSLDILAYTLIYYTLLRYVQTNHVKWLYFLALSFSIGFLNKYNVAFCILGLLPALALTKHRVLFAKIHFYGAMVLALSLISPNIIWQIQNDFPVLKHMKELQETQLVNVSSTDFLKEQFFFFIGSVFILIAGFISFFSYQPFKNYRFLFWSYIFSIVIFLFLHAKGYYAIGLYPIYIAFGSTYISILVEKRTQFWAYAAPFIVILFFTYPLFKFVLPIYAPETYAADSKEGKAFSNHVWEDQKKHPLPQDFADMLGWQDLARKVDSVYLKIADGKHTLILCDNYGQAGSINYYSKIKGLQANCLNTDYDGWIDLSNNINFMIRVLEPENNDLSKEHFIFSKVEILDSLTTPYARENGAKIVLLSDPKTDINQVLKNLIKNRNSQ